MSIPLATTTPAPGIRDPLQVLRSYHGLAPWSLKDLAGLAAVVLEASGVVPVNVAARVRPSERTIRYYVMRGLVESPDGRGTAAVYRYRHLLQVLAIKLRQMDGQSLDGLRKEFDGQTGDVLERRVAAALGGAIPLPDEVAALTTGSAARGRSARALHRRLAAPQPRGEAHSGLLRRIVVGPGVELTLEPGHPLFPCGGAEAAIAEEVAAALARVAETLAPSDP